MMKISTNSIGNYNPIRTQGKLPVNKSQQTNNEVNINKNNEPNITNEEKSFFTKLYPDQKESIENYHFYNKKGDFKGVPLGSIFDKRG